MGMVVVCISTSQGGINLGGEAKNAPFETPRFTE
jgi:hypothetical protein